MNNLMYEYQTGDGFRTLFLPGLNFIKPIIITHTVYKALYYKGKNAVTVQRLNNMINSDECDDIQTVVLDCRIPRIESKAYKSLLKLCKDKRIVIIGAPHDSESLAVIMSLLSVTKSCKLQVRKFNRFKHLNPWR